MSTETLTPPNNEKPNKRRTTWGERFLRTAERPRRHRRKLGEGVMSLMDRFHTAGMDSSKHVRRPGRTAPAAESVQAQYPDVMTLSHEQQYTIPTAGFSETAAPTDADANPYWPAAHEAAYVAENNARKQFAGQEPIDTSSPDWYPWYEQPTSEVAAVKQAASESGAQKTDYEPAHALPDEPPEYKPDPESADAWLKYYTNPMRWVNFRRSHETTEGEYKSRHAVPEKIPDFRTDPEGWENYINNPMKMVNFRRGK